MHVIGDCNWHNEMEGRLGILFLKDESQRHWKNFLIWVQIWWQKDQWLAIEFFPSKLNPIKKAVAVINDATATNKLYEYYSFVIAGGVVLSVPTPVPVQ